jgi:hypothetical protein
MFLVLQISTAVSLLLVTPNDKDLQWNREREHIALRSRVSWADTKNYRANHDSFYVDLVTDGKAQHRGRLYEPSWHMALGTFNYMFQPQLSKNNYTEGPRRVATRSELDEMRMGDRSRNRQGPAKRKHSSDRHPLTFISEQRGNKPIRAIGNCKTVREAFKFVNSLCSQNAVRYR